RRGRGRDQQAHLRGVRGIIQQEQGFFGGEGLLIQSFQSFGIIGEFLVRVERFKDAPHHFFGSQRGFGCTQQVDAHAGIGIRIRDSLRQPARQFGLADSAPAAHAGDDRSAFEGGFELREFIFAPGEIFYRKRDGKKGGNRFY